MLEIQHIIKIIFMMIKCYSSYSKYCGLTTVNIWYKIICLW